MSDPALRARRATVADCRLFWEWVNDPQVRAAAFDQDPIPWSTHASWFDARVRSDRSALFVVETDAGEPVGQVRFDLRPDQCAHVDLSVAAAWRGRRLGAAVLRLACDAFRRERPAALVAHIRPGNRASIRAFEQAGFRAAGAGPVHGHDAVRMQLGDVFVVAAIRSWNRALFAQRLASRPGSWVLIDDPAQLTGERLAALRPRYVFFLHWSWTVPAPLLEAYECVGFHMTDLPYGRGGSPLQNLILRGHRDTQLTAFRLVDQMDAGPVYFKAPLSLDGRANDIYVRASNAAIDLIDRIIAARPTPAPQEGEVIEFTRRTPAESRLPEQATPGQLYDFIRMLDADGYPHAFVEGGGWRVEFSHATLEDGAVHARAHITPVAAVPRT